MESCLVYLFSLIMLVSLLLLPFPYLKINDRKKLIKLTKIFVFQRTRERGPLINIQSILSSVVALLGLVLITVAKSNHQILSPINCTQTTETTTVNNAACSWVSIYSVF